jgi:hypothetical protein
MLTAEEASARLKELQQTMQYAFAYSTDQAIRNHPQSRDFRAEVERLRAVIAEHR